MNNENFPRQLSKVEVTVNSNLTSIGLKDTKASSCVKIKQCVILCAPGYLVINLAPSFQLGL